MNKRSGFTLVEILVALSILGVGIIVIFNFFPLGWQSFFYARRLNRVALLAEKKLEELKLKSEVQDEKGNEQDLSFEITTKPLKLSEGVEMTQVQLTIEFDFQGRQLKETFVTWVSGD